MGYQESLLLCSKKEDFVKLCEKLNVAKSDLNDYGVSVFAVGKLKGANSPSPSVKTKNGSGIGPVDLYFVWWGGERHPFQSGCGLVDEDRAVFDPDLLNFETVFCEDMPMKKMLSDIDLQNKSGVLQENSLIYLIVTYGELISDEYIQQLN